MSTYQANFKSLVNQGLSIHFKQNISETLIKCSKIVPSNYPESQTGLYLDVTIRDSSNHERSWASFENHIKQLFDQIVQIQKYPNSSIKLYVFVLEDKQQIKSCIINAIWLVLLKMGVNMKKSIYSWSKSLRNNSIQNKIDNEQQSKLQDRTQTNHIIYNLNSLAQNQPSIVQGQIHHQTIAISKGISDQSALNQVKQQLNDYKQFVSQTMQNIFSY